MKEDRNSKQNLIVSNIPNEIEPHQVKNSLAEFGDIEYYDGRSKGIVIV